MHRQSKKINGLVTVKKMGNIIRFINYKYTVKQKGFDPESVTDPKKTESVTDPKKPVNEQKLAQSLSRSRRKVYELALCNDWEFFATLTLDAEKYDRSDLQKFVKDFGQSVRDLRKKHGYDIRYLLVPELHSDGKSWHMHGLFNDFGAFVKLTTDVPLPYKILNDIKKGIDIYTWDFYNHKFGYCTFTKVNDKASIARYITKYIKKNLGVALPLGRKSYYATRGLKYAEVIDKGIVNSSASDFWAFENDYVNLLDLDLDDISSNDFNNISSQIYTSFAK